VQLTGRRCNQRLELFYESTPPDWRTKSQYVASLEQHGFSRPADLRPDLVLRLMDKNLPKSIIGEFKMGQGRKVRKSAWATLYDLLAYREPYRSILDMSPRRYGLVVAWGAHPSPTTVGGVLLCITDHLADALAAVLI
jgi:hypothetical protein